VNKRSRSVVFSHHRFPSRGAFRNNNMLTLEEAGMHEGDRLFMYDSHWKRPILWLQVHGAEHPFDSTGHFPVLAGYDTSGREIFVARAFCSDISWAEFCYVCDGARSVSIIGEDGKRRTTSRFDVMVLRHDPCDVGMEILAGAKFQTGPVFWMREEDLHSSSQGLDSETNSDFKPSEQFPASVGFRVPSGFCHINPEF